jgi:hypothetical protein
MWHPAILTSLIQRGCPFYFVRLVSCFLSCRTNIWPHNGFTKAYTVNLGCLQGGVLYPFLWVILFDYVLRLSCPFLHLISGYTDDLTVACSHKIPEIFTQNLQVMSYAISLGLSESKLTLMLLKPSLCSFKNSAQMSPTSEFQLTTCLFNCLWNRLPRLYSQFPTQMVL